MEPRLDSLELPVAAGEIVNAIQEEPGFFFLPPLAASNPKTVGEFNPNLAPYVEVCELVALGAACTSGAPIATLPASMATVDELNQQYLISWDTDGPETGRFNNNLFYRLQVFIGDQVVGHVDLDPQNPNGPGQSDADAYAFRVGETIPIKFWASQQILCEPSAFVTECITGAIIDQTGAFLALDDAGARLALRVEPNSLPANQPAVTVILERVDAALFLQQTGAECIPLFDAPQFGECFSITTIPELGPNALANPALVSICVDVSTFGLTVQQQGTLNMVRYNEDRDEYEALPDALGDCSSTQARGLLPVPEDGFLRYAAAGLNKLASLLAPTPLSAADIRLGGFTSSFSRFRFSLPGQMTATAGDGAVIQQGDDPTVDATATVLDYEGFPVEGATLHFRTDDGTPPALDVVTDAAGTATFTWTVDSTPGTKTLVARALGLVTGGEPNETGSSFLSPDSIVFTATVVGPPSSVTATPSAPLSGTAGMPAGNVSVAVTDVAGTPIEGAAVSWTGDGSVAGGTVTGADGVATGTWTLSQTAGSNSLTVQVGGITATFSAVGSAGPAVAPTYSGVATSGTAGLALADPVVVTVTDQFGNPRSGDAVTWTVTGGGSVSTTTGTTGADGSAAVNWTLGEVVGTNTLTVTVAGFTGTFTVDGLVGDAVQPTETTGSGQTGTVGEALAEPLTIQVTDAFGNPREGESVTWTAGGTTTVVPTDAQGTSSFTWTLDTTAGEQTATATADGFSPLSFTATAEPGPATTLNASGAGGAALVGATLTDLSIRVEDAYGNPLVGETVSWTAADGTITGTSPTDGNGEATASWTLGPIPGAQTAGVSAGGLSAGYTATAACFDGYGMATVDGTFSASEWSCASSRSFTANVSGGQTPAEVYWMNDGQDLYMAVRVRQSSLAKVNDLRIDFDNDGDGVAEQFDDAIGYRAETSTFFDEYLTQRCENRGQSGCGEADAVVDGAGAMANDGTWTVFELKHPLNSGQQQDLAAAAGQTIGFYLTLQSGNGAQGNTQYPGFRSYVPFRVVGF